MSALPVTDEFEADDDAQAGNRELPPDLVDDGFKPASSVTILDDSPEGLAKRDEEEAKIKAEQMFQGPDGKRIVPLIAINDDVHRVPGQNYACVSVIKPEVYDTLHHGERKYRGMLFKIRGVFETREEADDWIRNKVMNMDPHFDVHLIKCHSWSGLDSDNPEENEYMDDKIQTMMTSYFEEEHDKMLGIQARVQMAKRMTERSKEAGDFFRNAVANKEGQKVPGMPTLPEHLPAPPTSAAPTSLDEVRAVLAPSKTVLLSDLEEPEEGDTGADVGSQTVLSMMT